MIIWIDEEGRVISHANGIAVQTVVPDEKRCFWVEELPVFSMTEELFFDKAAKQFYTRARIVPDASELQKKREMAESQRRAVRERDCVLQWLSENDWKVNKHTLGEWTDTDPRWCEYLKTRTEMRAVYDRALAVLEGAKNA